MTTSWTARDIATAERSSIQVDPLKVADATRTFDDALDAAVKRAVAVGVPLAALSVVDHQCGTGWGSTLHVGGVPVYRVVLEVEVEPRRCVFRAVITHGCVTGGGRAP